MTGGWIPAFAGTTNLATEIDTRFCDLLIGGLNPRQNDFEMPDIARTILMHRSVRLGMRLAALLIILKLGLEMVSPLGGAFARFEWWVPVSLIRCALVFHHRAEMEPGG